MRWSICTGYGEYCSIGSTDFVLYCSVPLGLISRGGPPHFSIGSTGLLQQGSVHLGSIRKGASLFLNRFYWFAVVGFCTLGVEQQGRASSYLNKLYWFGVVGINTLGGSLVGEGICGVVGFCITWAQLAMGPCHFSIGYTGLVQQHSTLGVNQQERSSSFLNRLYWFGVVGQCTLGLD